MLQYLSAVKGICLKPPWESGKPIVYQLMQTKESVTETQVGLEQEKY